MGTICVNKLGRGFVICEDLEHDIMIPKNNINRAFQGDLVEVYAYKRKQKSGAFEGEIVTILKRKKTQFVGVLQIESNYAFVLTRGARMYTSWRNNNMSWYKPFTHHDWSSKGVVP